MKNGKVLILFILTIFFITSLWMLDVSVIAINNGYKMMNVYGSVYEPITIFHVGLFLGFISFLSLGVIFIKGEKYDA